jgi:predicted metallo-beta-lactamase superfamily hydrolase
MNNEISQIGNARSSTDVLEAVRHFFNDRNIEFDNRKWEFTYKVNDKMYTDFILVRSTNKPNEDINYTEPNKKHNLILNVHFKANGKCKVKLIENN